LFTGLIRDTGVIANISFDRQAVELSIATHDLPVDLTLGDSISVDGICLTVSTIEDNQIRFNMVEETLNKTNARNWKIGDKVHLERAMTLNDRLDGHLVSGHIDAAIKVRNIENKDEAVIVSFELPNAIKGFVVEKGSVTINGVSLTVAQLNDSIDSEGSFAVWLIPTTLEKTNLASLKIGDLVNLELDLIGKYVVQNLRKYLK
jgi:riboflavin synthase